jgi:hypothetical protein
VRLGELDAAEGRGGDGEGWFKRALRISRQHKPGDYSLGALIGLSRAQLKQNRKLEALQAALLCERSLTARIMPATDPDFYGELKGKAEAALNAAVAKLLRNVTDEARGRLEGTDLRAQLKELIEKSWA